MKPLKFKFAPGDDIPAESFLTIDPDNIISQTSGRLEGGTSPSAVGVFETLRTGANNGKIKANIDGTIYDNIAVDLQVLESTASDKISQTSTQVNDTILLGSPDVISFSSPNLAQIISFSFPTTGAFNGQYGGAITVKLRNSSNTVLSTVVLPDMGTTTGWQTATFSVPVMVTPGASYNCELSITVGGGANWYIGRMSDGTKTLKVNGKAYLALSSLTDVASALQTAIRTATSKTETVIYSVNKFIISSSTSNQLSKVLKLMTPTIGTDISGNNATKYLDLGVNATETAGIGEEYNLVRLDEKGALPDLIASFGDIVSRSDNTVYLAETNGLVICEANSMNHNYVYTDTANPPTTVVVDVYNQGAGAYTSNIVFPIKRGNYWKTVSCRNVKFISLGK